MKIYRSENTNMSSSQKKSLNSMISSAEELAHSGKVTAEQIEQIKIAFSGLKAEISETGRTGKNFFSQIRNRLTDINSKFIAQFLSWQEGSAREEQEKFTKGIQYSIDKAKASLEKLAKDFLSSDFLKGLIDAGEKIITFLDKIIDKFGVLPTLLTAIGAKLSFKKVGIDTLVAY